VCSTELRLGLLLVATVASVACIDPSQPQNSHKAAHIGAGANQKTRRNMPGTPTAHARHAYRDSARPQRTHAPSQAWTEASPICHASASAVSSRKGRQNAKKKKAARMVQAASVGACKEEAASPSQQLVQRQHQSVEAGKQTGGAGMRCVGGRIGGGGEGGGERDTWATHVMRGVMQRSVGV